MPSMKRVKTWTTRSFSRTLWTQEGVRNNESHFHHDQLAKGLAQVMINGKEPQAAADWYLGQVSEEVRPRAIRDVVGHWAKGDANAPGEWLSQFEPGPGTNEARAAFSQQVAGMDPESAIQWSETIDDPTMRVQSLTNVYAQWRHRDPTAAETAIRASGLPEARIQALLNRPR